MAPCLSKMITTIHYTQAVERSSPLSTVCFGMYLLLEGGMPTLKVEREGNMLFEGQISFEEKS